MLLIGLVGAGWLYHQAARVPEEYTPPKLSKSQRDAASVRFSQKCQNFYNRGQRMQPFSWTVTQEETNRYLASLDEIAAELPGGAKPGEINRALQSAGVSGPMVKFGSSRLTLMLQSTGFDKIVSLELKLDFPEPGKMQVHLESAKIGQLDMPQRFLSDFLSQAKQQIRSGIGDNGSRRFKSGTFSAQDIGNALASVLLAIDAEPIRTDIVVDGRPLRISKIEITDRELTLNVQPLGKHAKSADAKLPEARDDWPEEFKRRR